jgi:RNA polymerase sigma-70 factor, ECF subfamily
MSAPVPAPARAFFGVSVDEDRDRNLLRRVGCADRSAFEQLYHDYHRRLARFLGRLTPHRREVEAVINDALFIVWEHAAGFCDAAPASTWIFGIAYRCALKSLRRSAVRSPAAAHEIRSNEACAAGPTEEAQVLEFALSKLPLEQRLVLVLAYYMNSSCEEIAAIAECPVTAVKARMSQARRGLGASIAAAAAVQRARPEGCALFDHP